MLNKKKKVIGTITDGDLRRTILKKNISEDRVDKCMNKKPILGLLNETHNNYKKLKIIDLQNPFLPIMDNKGKLREILIGKNFLSPFLPH